MSSPIGVKEKLHSELPLRNRFDILSTLGELALPKNQYFVIGGANLVLRGIKSVTPDIDALVSDELFEELAAEPSTIIKQPPASALAAGATNTTVWIEKEGLAIPFTATTAMGDGFYPQSFQSHAGDTEQVEGIPCVSLEAVRASKLALQRAVDKADLRAIALHLGETLPEFLPEPTVREAYEISSPY